MAQQIEPLSTDRSRQIGTGNPPGTISKHRRPFPLRSQADAPVDIAIAALRQDLKIPVDGNRIDTGRVIKAGLFAVALVFLKKFWFLLFVPFAFLGKLFKRSDPEA